MSNEVTVTESMDIPVGTDRVWRALTVSDELAEWYGTYTGDPATGRVELTALEDPTAAGAVLIDDCVPGERMTVTLSPGAWRITVEVSGDAESSHVILRQEDVTEDHDDIAAGWRYYLLRLKAATMGEDPDAVDWEAVRSEYRRTRRP